MNIFTVTCPACNANVPIGDGEKETFCSYCGTKVFVANENEYTYRHIDEVGVKQAETDQMVRLRQMQLEEMRLQADEKVKKVRF